MMFKRLVLIGALALGLAGCDSLPEQDEQRAAALDTGLTRLSTTLTQREADFAAAQADVEAWAFFAPYAERENWAAVFTQTGSDLAGLRARYDSQVKPLLEADRSEDSAALQQQLAVIEGNFDAMRTQMTQVSDRMTLLREGYENADTWIADARGFVSSIDEMILAVQPVIMQTQGDFPERLADIDTRFVPLLQLQRDAQAALSIAESEYRKHENTADDTDYAAFVDAVTLTRTNAVALTEADVDYREQLASLSEEYITILRDMKIEYWVQARQENWCDFVDCRGRIHDFPMVAVSQDLYEQIIALEEISDAQVRQLGLNPNYDLGGSRGGSAWWIEDYEERYFHRYAEVNGSIVTEGEWEELEDASEYGEHIDSIGMAIATKRLGQFEDETVYEATPPGMDMVGDERYGRWETDAQGNERWSFLETYAMYHLLFGGNNYYYRNDYNSYGSWRNERRNGAGTYGWYGANRTQPRYGSTGSVTTQSPGYRSSSFAQAGGVSNRNATTLRQAGANARSRGPGGRGK